MTVCGLYLTFAAVRACVGALRATEVRLSDVSVLLRDGSVVCAEPMVREVHEDSLTCRKEPSSGVAIASSFQHLDRAASSSLTRSLLSLGIPVYDSGRLEERIMNGGILVLVRCADVTLSERIRAAMIETEAQDISLGRRPAPEPHNYPAVHTEAYERSSISEMSRVASA